MVKIETLINEGKVSKINELELNRYLNFFDSSYRDEAKEFYDFVVVEYLNKIKKLLK